jgi:hypothetical protein
LQDERVKGSPCVRRQPIEALAGPFQVDLVDLERPSELHQNSPPGKPGYGQAEATRDHVIDHAIDGGVHRTIQA